MARILGTGYDTTWSGPHTSDCNQCHQLRGASYPKMVGKLCQTCHYAGGPAPEVQTHSSRTTDDGYGNWDLDCWACHNPHTQEQNLYWGSTYGKYVKRTFTNVPIKLINPAAPGPYYPPLSTIRSINSSIVEFKGNTEFVDNDALRTDDICQVCHENTSNYSSLAPKTHSAFGPDSQPGGNCTSACHLHVTGFAASSCLDCHSQTQPNGSGDYRRLIVGTGGDFERPSHHVTDGTATEVVTNGDCPVCHNQNQHTANSDPGVYLNDPDLGAGSPITYDGTGASVEGFCLKCHDAGGPAAYDADANPGDGQQPFSDGRDAPDINTGWTGASHNASLTTEACLSCHGGADSTRTEAVTDHNIHGSANPKLLSGLVAGTTVANVQEELCYACHDGAPASTDIKAQFNGNRNNQITSSSTAKLNQRHDITAADQAYSGGIVECKNCHDPHLANASNKNIDPDTPTAAFSQDYVKTSSYTRNGYNYTYQSAATDLDPMSPSGCVNVPGGCSTAAEPDMVTFCLVCHDGTTPAGVTISSPVPTNIATSYRDNDQHGRIAGNGSTQGYLKTPWQDVVAQGDGTWATSSTAFPYAALQCTTCHDGHGSDNIYHLKTAINVRGADMTVGGAPGSRFTTGSTYWTPGDTSYLLPCFTTPTSGTQTSCSTPGATQLNLKYGAWCTFCHGMSGHSHSENEVTTCSSAHRHGSTRF